MDCRQEWHEIQPFIRGQLNGEQTKEFLEHLDQCPSCREELEIY
ncbi:MAG: zf-HC2 domain-containing protein, partial [Lachnoanaerobaculum sp.]